MGLTMTMNSSWQGPSVVGPNLGVGCLIPSTKANSQVVAFYKSEQRRSPRPRLLGELLGMQHYGIDWYRQCSRESYLLTGDGLGLESK